MLTKNEKRAIDNLRKKVGKTINQYNLVKENDNILIGLSGGKDSLVLLETLALRRRHLPVNYSLTALHITIENMPYKVDHSYLDNFCKSLETDYLNMKISIDLNKYPEKTPCFVCSWNRRKQLFLKTQELNCNKLALGHHLDDTIETFMINMLFHSSISALPPSLTMFNGVFEIIRPLILLPKKRINEYARLRDFEEQKQECPYGNDTQRAAVRKIIEEMEKVHKKARYNIFHSLSNIYRKYLPESIAREKEN